MYLIIPFRAIVAKLLLCGSQFKKATEFSSDITIYNGEKSADMKRLFAVMSLGVKKGDTVRITVSGSDEDIAIQEIEGFFKNNL